MNNKLYSYVFWFNTYQQLWYAIPSHQYIDFFNGERKPTDALKSNKIETLIYLIEHPNEIEKQN